jgi:hypothetical protein
VDDFSKPQLLLDGRLVLTGSARKPRKEITDILSWVEAFTVFSMIVCSYFPNRWRDLSLYKLLILRTYRQFAGYAWCDYDKAFRQHAAATRLLDWSELNVQLFYFHTAGSAYRGPSRLTTASNSSCSEPTGNRIHDCSVKCFSWNKGRCVAPSAVCRYKHACTLCSAAHREIECPSGSAASNSPIYSGSNGPVGVVGYNYA